VRAVQEDSGGDRGGSSADGCDHCGEDAPEEVAPVRERGGPPALEDAGFAGRDEADAVGVPSVRVRPKQA
jgi:hypothetical protein